MRRLLVVLVIAGACLLGGAAAAKEPPGPTAAPATPAHTRPWARLAIFIPASVVIGGAAIFGYRAATARGWIGE